MSQLIDVSNMPMPRLDTELAIKMTANARLPKMPQRDAASADESDLTLDWLDKWRSAGTQGSWMRPARQHKLDGRRPCRFQGDLQVRRRALRDRLPPLAKARSRRYIGGGDLFGSRDRLINAHVHKRVRGATGRRVRIVRNIALNDDRTGLGGEVG